METKKTMNMPNRVLPGDELYPRLHAEWIREDKPRRIFYAGYTFLAVQDNDILKFILEGLEDALRVSTSFPK